MNKYKIVGLIDIIVGIFQIFFSFVLIRSVIPDLTQIYPNFETSSQPNMLLSNVSLIVIVLFGLTNLFLGIKNLTQKKNLFYKYGIISICVTLFLTGVMIAIISYTIVAPIYNLTSP